MAMIDYSPPFILGNGSAERVYLLETTLDKFQFRKIKYTVQRIELVQHFVRQDDKHEIFYFVRIVTTDHTGKLELFEGEDKKLYKLNGNTPKMYPTTHEALYVFFLVIYAGIFIKNKRKGNALVKWAGPENELQPVWAILQNMATTYQHLEIKLPYLSDPLVFTEEDFCFYVKNQTSNLKL